MKKNIKIFVTGLGLVLSCTACGNRDNEDDTLWQWVDKDGNVIGQSMSPSHSKADDFKDFIDGNGEYISVFLLVVVAVIVGTILIILARKKNNTNTHYNNSHRSVDNNKRLLNNGGWECSKCGRVNANYVTTCVCGMAKMNNNKTQK